MQVATELVVGFPKSFINKEMLARQKQLWGDWLDGFLALPINLPGFGMQSLLDCVHAHIICPHACMPDVDKHARHADPYAPVMLQMFVQLPEIMSLDPIKQSSYRHVQSPDVPLTWRQYINSFCELI